MLQELKGRSDHSGAIRESRRNVVEGETRIMKKRLNFKMWVEKRTL